MVPAWRWAGVCAFVAVAAAQAPQRRAVVGQVFDREGAAVEGASIVLIGLQTGLAEFAADDMVAAASDARGRFQAKVLPGLPYCAFAAKAQPGGGGQASPVLGWFGAGRTLVLGLTESIPALAMQVHGLEAWTDRGPLRCFARPAMGDSYLPLPFARDWNAALTAPAPWPEQPRGMLNVVDGQGVWLWTATVAETTLPRFDLPPPREVQFVVVDDQDLPVAGAEILVRTGSWHDAAVDGIATHQLSLHARVAVTDANGRAAAQLPYSGSANAWPAHLFVARAKGFAESVSGRRGNDGYENDQRVVPMVGDAVRFRLAPAAPRTGRIVGLPSSREPWSAVLRVTAKLHSGPNGFVHDVRSYPVALAEDGSYAIEHVPGDVHASQWLVRRGPTSPPMLFAWKPGDNAIEPAPAEASSRLSIAVFDVTAGPASGRAVYLVRKDSDNQANEARIRVVVDAGGRAVVDVAPGTWTVACIDVDGMAVAEVDLSKRSEPSVELRLVPFATERGTLVDADGKPVANARFVVRAQSGNGGDRLLREWAVRGLRRLVADCRTEADGSFAVPLPLFEGQNLALRAELGNRSSLDFTPKKDRGEPLRVALR